MIWTSKSLKLNKSTIQEIRDKLDTYQVSATCTSVFSGYKSTYYNEVNNSQCRSVEGTNNGEDYSGEYNYCSGDKAHDSSHNGGYLSGYYSDNEAGAYDGQNDGWHSTQNSSIGGR